MSSPITTHILDTSLGRPAVDVNVILESSDDGEVWQKLGQGQTNVDGRVVDLLDGALEKGAYRLRFHTQPYFERTGRTSFYPSVTVEFHVEAPDEHYHVPLLLNPFGYSTYRGS